MKDPRKMTIREYAEYAGFEVVGKLTKKVREHTRYNWAKGEDEIEKIVYWQDEAGNIYYHGKNGNCIDAIDGGCY